MLTITYDEGKGIIITTAQGLTTAADFDAYIPILIGMKRRSAARHGPWLHLVDASESTVQTRQSADHVTHKWNEQSREDGHTAYIVASTLAKMQIDRMREHTDKTYFTDRTAACEWLLARARMPAIAEH